MFKKIATEYFSFTKKERTGIGVILLLILLLTLLPFLFPYFITTEKYDHKAFEKEIATLKIKESDSTEKYAADNYNEKKYYYPSKENYPTTPKGSLFYFDPNTLTNDGWKKLGIRDKTISTIQNYLSKGGHFYKPEDIGKIWGLHEDEVKRLLPYVSIPQPAYTEKKEPENKPYSKKPGKAMIIDINTADTSAFIALPGIGSKLANRIINFREKLGGFCKIEQLAETFGLPDSTFQKIRSSLVLVNASVKKININTATVDEMKVHPYIRYNLAAAIVQYRTQHGNFQSVADLKKIMMVTDDIYNKAAAYLSTQ